MSNNKIPVAEIFGPTIQGEGPHVGMKTIFVRVCGCDFNCEWCDSKFAWKRTKDTKLYEERQLAEELIKKCIQSRCKSITLTGGNPCLYNLESIINSLHDMNITVDIETQGSILPYWIYKVDCLVISPKAPSSKQPDVYDKVNQFLNELWIGYTGKIAIKIPVFNDEDIEFCKKYYELCENHSYLDLSLYISVGNDNTEESGDISKRILSNYEKIIDKIIKSNMQRVFILPQVHTLVWGNKQGV